MNIQETLFPLELGGRPKNDGASTTFADNMRLPVHRWVRYSAGFSGAWAQSVIEDAARREPTRVLDPFCGSGTTLIAAENSDVEAIGIDSHPFVGRIALAKLAHRSSPSSYLKYIRRIMVSAASCEPNLDGYSELIRRCYSDTCLRQLDCLRRSVVETANDSPEARLAWLTLVSILRKVSHVGTANWQYLLPGRSKAKATPLPFSAFEEQAALMYQDMGLSTRLQGPRARFLEDDARTCSSVPKGFATLVVTSPPYPNNFDYADATRLEMTFFGEIAGWGDLQTRVRQHLLRSCSQHVPGSSVDLEEVLIDPVLEPIRTELAAVCRQLGEVRMTKGGRKTYHLMVACYFQDLARTWHALRAACASPSRVCFVVGDSAPYGVYVPVVPWLGSLALAAGFKKFDFEKTRDRNVKWKNRKHRVPLQEGRLWVVG